ncbi:MAG: uroporphyrinogen decarboxylase family protein [Anaerolineae bacterium]
MNSKQRLLSTAAFREPDRVPIELSLPAEARGLPEVEGIAEFIANEVDHFVGVAPIDWGFLGLDSKYQEEIIQDVPGEFRRIRRTQHTVAGDFYAITKHNYPNLEALDYHWERRYIDTLEEMERLADAPRVVRPISATVLQQETAKIGDRGVPIISLAHSLGTLVRQSNMERVYMWLLSEPAIVHRFLESTNMQVRDTLHAAGEAGITGWYVTYAHEMLIPPWMGHRLFDEVVFPYDKVVNDELHRYGSKHRSHCHGNSMQFLKRMSEMGVDASEPLEPPPFGDCDLREAKRLVGDRMLLSGNVPSQDFVRMSREEVRQSVREAISAAAPGGGFTLRLTGGSPDIDPLLDKDMLHKIIENTYAYIEAGMEFGEYPIHL